jgi:hypothetical protein
VNAPSVPPHDIHTNDPTLTTASVGELFCVLWHQAGDRAHIRQHHADFLAFARARAPRKIALMTVMQMPKIGSLSEEIRTEITTSVREQQPYLVASTLVLPNTGFVAALVRGVVGGMQLIIRSNVSTKVLDSPDAALRWLAPHISTTYESLGASYARIVAATNPARSAS